MVAHAAFAVHPLLGHRRSAFLVSLMLSAVAGTVLGAAGLRFLPPVAQTEGAVHLFLGSSNSQPLTPDHASRIEVLRTSNINLPAPQWSKVAGPRTLSNGVLSIEYSWSNTTPAVQFFLAREVPLPPAVLVSNAASLRAAVATAKPGNRIWLAPGIYAGGFYFAGVRGQSGLPIVIAAADPLNPPLIQGGANGMHFSDPEWLELQDLVLVGATGNGLNLDDGGSFDTPARNIVLRGLRISDVGPQGNRDGIKLSGVLNFRVEHCTIERWGTGGSAVDMVGCHSGVIESNLFRHTSSAASSGANGVQTKGGSREVVVRRNRFEHAGAHGVNIGGSTGLEFFRPPLSSGGEHSEATDILVEGNTFIGSTAPVAFVGADGATVRFNTFYRCERWAIRILQETTAPGFVACRNGRFTDNIVAFHSSQWSSGGVNIGPNTAPGTFEFTRNWWFCLDTPSRSRPVLPVAETEGVYGISPAFRNAEGGDVGLQPDSPAREVGAEALRL